MGEALFELEQILRSKHHQEKLTSQEANVLMTCKGRAIREFTIGAGAGGGIAWLVSRNAEYLLIEHNSKIFSPICLVALLYFSLVLFVIGVIFVLSGKSFGA